MVRFHVTDATEKLTKRAEIMQGAVNGTVDVVVTTYDMLVSEKNSGVASMRFRYLVLDEAHKVSAERNHHWSKGVIPFPSPHSH